MAAHSLSLLPISPAYSHCKSQSFNSIVYIHNHSNNIDNNKFGSSFTGNKLSVRFFGSPNYISTRHSSTVATVAVSPPAGKTGRSSPQKYAKWSARALKSYAMAELEARKLKYPNTGTEALLMGILVEGTSFAAKFLRENGITLFKVRDETVKLLGKSDMYFFSPEHPPLTEPAQRALDWAITEKLKSGEDGEVTVAHFLLGVWSEKESAGHKIMAALGFDDEKAKKLSEFMGQDIDLGFKKRS